MRVTFHGAAGGEVTGSCHLVEAAGRRILLDCGMLQGGRDAEARNHAPFAFDPAQVDALVISHAHIDHCGRVPLLVRRGFRGTIHVQRATGDLLPVMWRDAAALSARAAERDNRARGGAPPLATPLYTPADVALAQRQLRAHAYAAPVEILPGVTLQLHEAGHILGSAVVELRAEGRTLVFSGDLGMRGAPILRDPAPRPPADLVLLESTYGDRDHRDRAATVAELGAVLAHARADGGNVVIPAFAVGRSQELLYWFAAHFDDWNLAPWTIFLDSPMAAKVMAIYERHHELFDAQAGKLWQGRRVPFKLPNLRVCATPEESRALARIHGGAIIIAGSGMANGGRVRHHLANYLGFARHHVVFVGYQAAGTLGRQLVNRAPQVRLFGADITVRAAIHTIGGLSAHADQRGLLDWYASGRDRPPVVLVHGESEPQRVLAHALEQHFGVVPVGSRAGASAAV